MRVEWQEQKSGARSLYGPSHKIELVTGQRDSASEYLCDPQAPLDATVRPLHPGPSAPLKDEGS